MKKNFYIGIIAFVLIVIIVFTISFLGKRKKGILKDVDSPSLLTLYNDAKKLESQGAYLKARNTYKELVEKSKDGDLLKKARQDLTRLNMDILFSPAATEDSFIYTVKKGDTLTRIAKKFNTTVELIMRSNGLKSDLIGVGKRLKISTAKHSVMVDYSQNVLTLKSNADVLKTYTVSTGMNNSTPLGTFKIINKLKDPVWYTAGAVVPSGSPDNILGSRWMGLSIAGYGIHGTIAPESIGRHITAGCVRMEDKDVQELYAILPLGTEVTIVE